MKNKYSSISKRTIVSKEISMLSVNMTTKDMT